MSALLGSRETDGMSKTTNKTVKWFRRDDSDRFADRSIATGGADGSSFYPSAAPRSASAGRSGSAPRARSLRLAAASLAGLIGIGAASFGAVSAQADEVAPSSALISSQSLAHGASVLTLDRPTPSGQSAKRGTSKAAQKRDLKAIIQELVDAGYPGALAAKTDKDGNAVGVTAGKGNLATGEAPPLDGEVRIGSNTKTFVAVVIMKMVEEGKVKLDEPIETYLPGLIKGQGVDGKKITVRQLLQHTSGLPEFLSELPDFFAIRNDYVSPRDILDMALTRPAQFAPGAKFTYTNTNYIVLGLLAERVAKRPIAEQIEVKIVKPLGLKHTYMPKDGEKAFRGKHPHGYHTRDNKPGKLEDITEVDPSWAWAAGSMISTPSELNKFTQALHSGKLLRQASVTEMKKVVATDKDGTYGLGIFSNKLSCGVAWGHTGGMPGYLSARFLGPDGSAVTVVTTAMEEVNGKASSGQSVLSPLDKAFCGS